MNSIIESQESLSDFKKSINLVSNNIEEVCSSKVYLSHKLKINVDEDYDKIVEGGIRPQVNQIMINIQNIL